MWKKLQYRIRNYFAFSHSERKAFIPMFLAMAIILACPFVWSAWVKPSFHTHLSDRKLLDSLVAELEVRKVVPTKQPHFADPGKPPTDTHLFAFDPNTINAQGWQQLGLKPYLAERIVKYRNKGGKFRVKEDIKKIFGFPKEQFALLQPYILLPDSASARSSHQKDRPALSENASDQPKGNFPPREDFRPRPFDLNLTDTVALIKLKGVGPATAGRIVRYRERLGGFVRPEQLYEVYKLDSAVVEEVLKYASLAQPGAIRKIKVNTATADELSNHPYISPKLAGLIVAYRQQHGPYTDLQSLARIRPLDAATLDRLAPYLSFEP